MFVDAPPSWDEIANTKEFQSLTPNEKANVQRRWVFDRMNYDYDRGNEIDQKAMVKEFKKNSFEPTVINTGFKDFTDYRSYMEGQQAEGLQGKAREEALSPQYSFGEGLLVSNEQRMGALGVGLVRPFEGMAGLADMTVGKALEAVTGSRMGIDKLADNLHGIVADMGRGVEADIIHGFSEGGFGGGVSALVNMVLIEAPNQIIQLGIGAAGIPQPYALAMLGASSMGSKYNDLKNDQSLSELQKYSIATLNGAIEGVTELMDSIPFIKRMTSSTKQAIFREALRSKPFRTIGKEFLKTFVGEATEEATGEFLQNISEAVIRGEKIDWKELGVQVANAGIGGGVMGGMMGVGGVAYNRHADNKRTSRKAFQEMKAMQAGFNPASKEFSRIAKSADLPEKYSTREGRRKAIDDYDFHGEPIVFGEATDEDKKAALKERIAWYENIRDHIEDGDEKAEWDGYYEEWLAKLDGLMKQGEEQLKHPVDENGKELVVTEETTEEQPPAEQAVAETETTKTEEKPVEKTAEEKPKEPPRWTAEHPNHEKAPGGHYVIVDANDILVSGDKGHLPIMQNRSEGAERTMLGHPNVSKMFTEGLTNEGAPIAVLRDGKLMVVSGNGRTKARRLMATRRMDMEYLNKLQQWAKDNGVEMPKGMQAPMLLRVIDENLDDEQLKDFVRQANMDEISKAGLSTMSEDEQAAKVDELINKYSPQETPSPTAEVKELAKTPKDRLNSFLETVSTEGKRNRSFVSNNLSEIIEGDTGTKPLYEYIEDDLKNGYVPYEYEGNYYFKKNDRDSFSVSEDMFNYAKWLIEHKDEWGGVPATEEKQPTSKKRKKRSAIDAYMEDGSFDDDADMPAVEGERRVSDTPKKAAKKNPMLRGSVENETRTQEQTAAKTDVEGSFVEQISKAAKAVADGFGYKVVVHKNDADIPANVKEDLAAFGEGTHAESWVGSDGVVHLVASRLESSADAVKKVLHEIVGHNGLAALFKGRNTDAWNDMVEKLWEGYKGDILKRCGDYLNVFDMDTDAGRSNLVEEWLARLAETNRKPIWWKSIVSKVRALLRSLGLGVEYSDVDIQQLLADAATAARRAQDANMEDANIRYSVAKPVQDETSPIPQGPLPPIANIMRQRTARSPISNLRALRLPAIVMLGRKLGGNLSAVDRIKRMPSALGVFREGTREIEVIRSLVEPHQLGDQWVVPQGKEDQKAEIIKDYWAERGIPRDEIEIVMKTDEAAKEVTIKAIWHDKSQTLFKKVLGHEIGHLIDYNQGETTSHGNVLGTVGGMGYKYLRKIIGETPDNQIDFEKFEKRKKELHKQAEGLAGEKPKDADELKAWRETVKAEYANLLTSECEKNGWFQAAVIREELIANTEWWSGKIGSDPNYRRYRTRPTELFAEAMSVLLNAPEKFAEQMPETWRMLQNYQKERPEFHKAWQGLMRMMNNEDAYNEALDKLADAGYTADENTYREIVKNNNNLWLDFCSLFHQFSYIEDAAMKLVKSGEVKFDDTPLAPIVAKTHMTEQTLYLAKAQRFVAPLNKVGIDNHTIGKFLEWKRIVNDPKINKGHIINPNGMTVYDAEDALNGLHKKLGDEKWQMLEDWHKKLWQLRQEFVIDLAEKSGAYTKELITQMRENEWYSYRAVIEKIYDDNGKEKASSGLGQIYGLKGTLNPIANPLGWTYEHDIMLMRGIRENMARRATVEFMKRYFPELIERVNKFSSWNKSNPPVGWSNLVVLENGKPVTYRIVKNWVSGFEPNMLINGPVGRVIYHPVIQFPLNLFRRAWTTFCATFMMGNPVRDYGSSVLHLGGIAPNVGIWEFTKQWAKGMKESFGFEFMDDFKTAKKIMESAFGIRFRDNIDDFPLMEEALRRNILQPERGYDRVNELGGEVGDKSEELFRRYGVTESRNPKWDKWEKIDRLGLVYKYANFIEKITTSFERGAKLGGLLALKNAGMSEGEVNYNVSKNIGSPDFQDRGILTPIANTVFIFSNASIQGMSSLWYSIKANPKALAVRFMTTVGTAVTIQWLLESGVLRNALLSMYGGDKDKAEENILYRMLDWMQKMYGKITHYNRYHFLCMPIPFTEQEDGSVFMLRIPYAENAKLPAMIMHAALDAAHTDIEKDKNLMNETVDALLGQGLNLNPVIKGGMDVGTMLAGNNPYDYYRGRQAVKYSEWEAGGLRRFKGATSYLYNQYSPVSQLKYDTRDPYLAFNLFAQTSGIGAFIKPQKYGETEQSRAVTKKRRRKKLNGKASAFYR